jgi:hypothetical protein
MMYPIPGECPVCHADLHVTQLLCRHCGTELRGHFEMDRLSRLLPEQRHFVEIFILCEGKLNCVQEELGISYPTVRSRLDEVIRTLKFKVQDEETAFAEAAPDYPSRQDILARLARQEISAEEALQLLSKAQ